MTWSLSVISSDTEYSLSDGNPYYLVGLSGIDTAPVSRVSERGPLQHGETDVGYRLQPRTIVLALEFGATDYSEWFDRRNALMQIFRSSDESLSLRIIHENMTRQIDCHLQGAMEMAPMAGQAPRWQRVGLQLRCPDPTWYDPDGESIAFAPGGTDLLEVPLVVPMRVGSSVIDSSIQISYPGTWDSYPIITLQGPMTDPVVVNETMGDKLDFTGTTINAGDCYVVDCRYGHKSVTRESDGANRIRDLTSDSNLATFRIGSHPDVTDGYNSIRVTASGATASSTIYIQYYVRYIGV